MVATMHDISGFVATVWAEEFMISYAKRDNIFPHFRHVAAAPGVKYIDVPVFGGLTANARTPGGGADVTLQTGTRTSIRVTLDKIYETSVLNDSVEDLQSKVEYMGPMVEEMSNALLGQIDTQVLTMLAAWTSLPAANQKASAAEITDTGTNVADEVERLIMEACAQLDTNLGVNVGNRFVLIDSWANRKLIKDSPKQSPERTDVAFGYASGNASPIQGCDIIPFTGSTTNRSYAAAGYTQTTIKFYVCTSDAIALGVQQTPDLKATYEGMKRSDLLSAEEVFGLKEGVSDAMIECSLIVDGDLFGLA